MQKPLRIAFYSPELPESGFSNGIVTYTGIIRDALRGLGHSVMVVTHREVEHFDQSVRDLPSPNRVVDRLRSFVDRNEDGSARVRPLPLDLSSGLKASEQIARGWLNGT